MNKEILSEVILSNQEFILNYSGKIYSRSDIYQPQKLKKVLILYGVRRSGKTFILYDYFRKSPDCCLYLDFEDDRLNDFKFSDFSNLSEIFYQTKPECINKNSFFLLDEVQKVEGWEKFCRRIVEREKVKVIVSGSSSNLKPKNISTIMRGRSWSHQIYPLSVKEYLKFHNIKIDSSLSQTARIKIIQLFNTYLKWGGFPEVVLTNNEFEKKKIVEEYLDAMFFRDLIDNYNMTNINLFNSLKDFLFSNYSAKFSLNSFYKQYKHKFTFSKDLLYRYYHYFIDSMLVNEVKIFSESSYMRMRNPTKVYLVDNSLCSKLFLKNSGRLFENMVFGELLRKKFGIHYWDDDGECDFITVDKAGKCKAIQVCFRLDDSNREREIKGLISACKGLGIDEGEIIVFDQREKEFEKDGILIKVRNFHFFGSE